MVQFERAKCHQVCSKGCRNSRRRRQELAEGLVAAVDGEGDSSEGDNSGGC